MRYPIELSWSDEHKTWIRPPRSPCCSAIWATPERAAAKVQDAIEAWVATCRAAGDPMPEPSSKARPAA